VRGPAPAVALAAVLSLAAPLKIGLTAGFTSKTAPPPARQGFGEQLAVRETELVFGPDDALEASEPADAFRVSEDGHDRPVARAERLATDAWTIVVYVDPVLASPETGHLAALALARASEALAARAAVELVIADPAPATVLAATREPRVLANRFADLAGELARPRDRGQSGRTGRPPDLAAVRRQLDRLVAFLAGRPRPAPHALLLVADGWDFPPDVLNALDRDRVDPEQLPEANGARAYARAAQVLAAYRWVTFPLALRAGILGELGTPPPVRGGISPAEARRVLRGMHPSPPPDPLLAEYGADPRLAVLRAVARMTGGGVMGSLWAIEPRLDDLAWRWHLWFSAPPAVEGRVHAVTLSLLRSGAALRGPQWVRSGVPDGLADARLGALLAASGGDSSTGSGVTGDLRVELVVEKSGAGTTVRARLASPLADPAGPLRISIATEAGLLRRELLKSSGDIVELTPPPSATPAQRIAAVIEDLGGERWGGAVADLPAPP